jgi:hypothetical protein
MLDKWQCYNSLSLLAGGGSEVREATNKEPHVCGRARVSERPVSSGES